jgi:hypothetical protein
MVQRIIIAPMSAAKEADKDCPSKGVQFVKSMMPKTRNGFSRNTMRYLFETGSITSSD